MRDSSVLHLKICNAINEMPDGALSIDEIAKTTAELAVEYLAAAWDIDALGNRVDELETINRMAEERWETIYLSTEAERAALQKQSEKLAAELQESEARVQILETDAWCMEREISRLRNPGSHGAAINDWDAI